MCLLCSVPSEKEEIQAPDNILLHGFVSIYVWYRSGVKFSKQTEERISISSVVEWIGFDAETFSFKTLSS